MGVEYGSWNSEQRMGSVDISVRILITEEEGIYNATCLEMGLAAAGPDLPTVKQDMLHLIVAHISACIEEGRPQDIFVPAPPEYWWVYARAVADSACQVDDLFPTTVAGMPGRDIISHFGVRSFVCPASYAI